jgi:hypothetical protein
VTEHPHWTVELKGWTPDARAARSVFEGALTEHLRWRGATSTQELQDDVSWFWLRLSPGELQSVIEAARRDELIAPLDQEKDASGATIESLEWTLTDSGQSLRRARGLAVRDLFYRLRTLFQPALSGIEKQAKGLGLLLGLVPGLAAALGVLDVAVGVALALVGVLAAIVLASAIRGETSLHIASRRWPRLKTCRPRIYEWQNTRWKLRERPVVAWTMGVYLALVVLGLGLAFDLRAWYLVAATISPLLLSLLIQGVFQGKHRRIKGQYNRESDEVRAARYDRHSTDPCDWGSRCPVAVGTATVCPKFGPKGIFESPDSHFDPPVVSAS